jgi:hypothetical protein
MTYHDNDPRRPTDPALDPLRPSRPAPEHRPGFRDRDRGSMAWILGAVALIAAVGLIFWAMSDRPTTVATTERPAITQQGTTPIAPRARNPDTNVGGPPPAQR